MSVTIEPANTSDMLAVQLDELRAASKAAMKTALGLTAEALAHIAPGSLGTDVAQNVTSGLGVVNGSVFPRQEWAKYVDAGTGIYVEHHSPIRPLRPRRVQNSRAALKLRGGQFRHSVRGQRPQRFIERAREQSQERVVQALEQPAIEITNKLMAR